MATKHNFYINGNSTWISSMAILNGSAPLDISTYDFRLDIKPRKGANVLPYLSLTVGAGIAKTDAPNGELTFTIEPREEIISTKEYVYDLVAIINGQPFVWIEGLFVINPGVTYL